MVNRLFVLAFEDDAQRTSNEKYYLPNLEIKDYNAMIDRKKLFSSTSKRMIILERLLLVKEMTIHLVVC